MSAPAGDYLLVATSEWFLPFRTQITVPETLTNPSDLIVRMVPNIVGSVISRVSETPIDGVKLSLYAEGVDPDANHSRPVDTVQSDDGGEFVFLVPAGNYLLVANEEGFLPFREQVTVDPETFTTDEALAPKFIASMVPTTLVSGRVEDELGAPVSTVTVMLFPPTPNIDIDTTEPTYSTRTSGNGEFTIEDVVIDTYRLVLRRDNGEVIEKTVSFEEGVMQSDVGDFVMEPFITTYYGSVVDQYGIVTDAATVTFSGWGGELFSVQTDSNGEFVVNDVHIVVSARHKLTISKPGSVFVGSFIFYFDDDENESFVEFVDIRRQYEITRPTALVNVFVDSNVEGTFEDTFLGTTWTMTPAEPALPSYTDTMVTNHSIFGSVPAGEYTIVLSGSSFGELTQEIIVRYPEMSINFEVTISEGTALGSVFSASDDSPVSFVNISLYPAGANPENTEPSYTDEAFNGRFEIANVALGNYTIVLSKEGYEDLTQAVVIDTSFNILGEFRLILTEGDVSGKVVRLEKGIHTGARDRLVGVGDVNVSLYPAGANPDDTEPSYTTQTDDFNFLGDYLFENVPLGEYTIVFSKEGYEDLTQAVTVANPSNDLGESQLVLVEGTASGNVSSATNGSVLSFTNVRLYPAGTNPDNTEPSYTTQTDGLGNFEITNVAVGDYTIVLSKRGFEDLTQAVTVANPFNFIGLFQLTPLDEEALVTVKGSVWNFISSVNVRLYPIGTNPENTEPSYTAQTNDLGEFEIANVAVGDYTIVLSKEGYEDLIQEVTVANPSSFMEFELTPLETAQPEFFTFWLSFVNVVADTEVAVEISPAVFSQGVVQP